MDCPLQFDGIHINEVLEEKKFDDSPSVAKDKGKQSIACLPSG